MEGEEEKKLCYFASCMASSYVLTETSKGESEKQSIFSMLTYPCVSQPRFYESSDGEFISAGKCFDKWKGKKKKNSVISHLVWRLHMF